MTSSENVPCVLKVRETLIYGMINLITAKIREEMLSPWARKSCITIIRSLEIICALLEPKEVICVYYAYNLINIDGNCQSNIEQLWAESLQGKLCHLWLHYMSNFISSVVYHCIDSWEREKKLMCFFFILLTAVLWGHLFHHTVSARLFPTE